MADTVSHEYTPDAKGGSFVMRIAQEGKPTVDGRIFSKDAIGWRKPPIPLMFHRANDPSGRGGHKASVAIGSITDIWKETDDEGFSAVFGRGYFSTDDQGQEARQLIKEGVISGVSADVGGAVTEELEAEFGEDGEAVIHKRITSGEIVAVTCLPIPAFNDMRISEKTVVASANGDSWNAAAENFINPNLTEITPLTVTAGGRVFGHVAAWGTCHIGYKDRCVTPPRSKSNYQFFNVGQVETGDGKVNVGRLTAGTGHADMTFAAQPAVSHYDDTGWAAAYVTAGEDEHGIWVSGQTAPGASDDQLSTLRASSVSGDWRSINGGLEMVGLLAVNTPGFPVPRAKAGLVAGAQVSLVAAGFVDCGCGCEGGDCDDKKKSKKGHELSEEDDVETPDSDTEELRINMDEEADVDETKEEFEEDDVKVETETEEVTDDSGELSEEASDTDDFDVDELDAYVLYPETI